MLDNGLGVTKNIAKAVSGVAHFILQTLTSNQVGLPAELKHINKRRKRNQQGLPQ